MKPMALLTAITLLLCIVAVSQPAHAICVSARLFNSGDSYVITPGCEAADCGSHPTSISDNADGQFWALGNGDTAVGVGIDNGAYPALGGWVAFQEPGYPAWINSNWASSTAIDNCIDFATDPRCMAILLTDERPDSRNGVFALMTRSPDSLGNYSFDAGGDIILGGMGRPNITGITFINEVIVGVAIDGIVASELDAALYLDPACEGPGGGGLADVVQGYEIFATVLPWTADPPEDPDVNLWQQVTGVIPIGSGMQFEVACEDRESMWVRAGLVFDSGYRTPFLSEQSTRVECTRTLADPEDPVQRKPRNRERPRSRSRGR